jgi:orotidine-5'-phosphate decarboxylase
MSEEWTHQKNCQLGLVTGATDIPALKRIRELAPSAWFLCPGVGAQGGSAEVFGGFLLVLAYHPKSVCQAALRKDGSGLLISVSRGISDPKALADGKEMGDIAREFRDHINSCRNISLGEGNQTAPPPSTTDRVFCRIERGLLLNV